MAARGWCPFAEVLQLTTGEELPDSPAISKKAVCNHITDGKDSRNHLQNVKNDASVHFLIRVEVRGGKRVAVIYQFVSIFRTAFGNGRHSGLSNPWMPEWVKAMVRKGQGINFATISIEHEGVYPTDLPFDPLIIEASIRLHK